MNVSTRQLLQLRTVTSRMEWAQPMVHDLCEEYHDAQNHPIDEVAEHADVWKSDDRSLED